MDRLPATQPDKPRDVFVMTTLYGLENVTKALIAGHAFDLNELRPLANRCRALASAFDARIEQLPTENRKNENETT